jgi:hypothetical protein
MKCTNIKSHYAENENFKGPVCPALVCDPDVSKVSTTPGMEAVASNSSSMRIRVKKSVPALLVPNLSADQTLYKIISTALDPLSQTRVSSSLGNFSGILS